MEERNAQRVANQDGSDSLLPAMRKGERFHNIDLIEALAMLFVVIYHTQVYDSNIMPEGGGAPASAYANYMLRGILSTCVPLFFFANGFLLFNRPLDLKKHLRRTGRFIVLTIVWAGILCAAGAFLTGSQLSPVAFVKTVWDGRVIAGINPLWFMGALVCLYVFFPLLKVAFDDNRKVFLFFVAACALFTFGNKAIDAVATLGVNAMAEEHRLVTGNAFNMFNPFRGIYAYSIVYFCLGGLAFGWIGWLKSVPPHRRTLVSAAVLFVMTGLLGAWGIYCSAASGKTWDSIWNGYDTLFTLANVLAIFALTLDYGGGSHSLVFRVVRVVSSNTLGIYFLHMIFMVATRRFVLAVPMLCNFPVSVLYACSVVAACVVAVKLLKRVPIFKLLV